MRPKFDGWRAIGCFVYGLVLGTPPAIVVVLLAAAGLGVCGATPPTALVCVGIVVGSVAGAGGFVLLDRRDQVAASRVRSRACVACGFSLRHLRASTARCPECGRRFRPRVRHPGDAD